MPNTGYSNLQMEFDSSIDSSQLGASGLAETLKLKKDTMCPQPAASLQTKNNDSAENSSKKSGPKHENSFAWRSKPESSKYTAMRPTYVRELNELDIEGVDHDHMGSTVHLTAKARKPVTLSKVHAIICGLLIISVALVIFGVIYVFLILPAYKGKVIYPDGKTHSADQIQSLGKNVVKISCGHVQGMNEQGAYVFKGIPYALPPIGSRRWKAPEAVSSSTDSCWQGVLNASEFGNKCVQPKFIDISTIEGDEDCLYINVWTPSLSQQASLPVMVWFHSGDFVYGSGHMKGMSPTPKLAMDTNSVYISFNYRLGAFGFLAVDELREEPKGPVGNYGFMDQQLALTWVKENIRHFGGNENMVTIFGHGSGATSVHAMLSSSGSSGLFHKAWLTSPVAVLNKTVDEACRDNRAFLQRSKCQTAHCLRAMTPEDVSKSSPWPLDAHWTLDQLFSIPRSSQLRNDLPIFDGQVVHLSSQKSGPDGPVVPVVFGSTYFDLSSLETEKAVVNMTWDDYENMMIHLVDVVGPDAVRKARALYSDILYMKTKNLNLFPTAPSTQFTHIVGDIKDVCPVKILADDFVYLYSGSVPIYMYVAEIYPSHNMKFATSELDTFVGWDIAAFFDSFQDLGFEIGQGEVNFQNILREEIMSFVKSSHPDASRWNTVDVNVGIFTHDVTVTPVTSEYFGKCDLWKQYQFFRYRWNESE